MDRTAWIVVVLCVIGLVLWELYLVKQTPPRPAPVNVTPGQISPAATIASPTPPAAAEVAPKTAEPVPSFPEKIETLRNSDVELRLTNRGGGIKEAVLLKQVSENGQRVVLNSAESAPIGSLIEQPSAPALPEFSASTESDSVVRFEHTTAEQVAIRKKFFFQQSPENKDNFVAEMDVDFENRGTEPYRSAGYFVALGSAAPIHSKDYPSYTRVVWCIAGKAKGIDVGWFGGGSGFLGLGQRAERPFYQENIAGAEWVAVSDQFFTTLLAPLTAKADAVWGRRFDIQRPPDQKLLGIEGALGMPGFELQPGQTYSARFEIYVGPKLYHRLAQLPHNEAEIMDFGMFKLVCQFLLNFMNLLHSWLHDYGLFKMLGQAVELRNAKFLWVKDLSQPDTVAHLPLLGWPINIIPLCMAATQIYTEESRRLIGRNGETLEAIQFLLNRLLQAKDKDAEKVIVDCEHYRSMREDRIVQRVRELADRVRITGRSLQLEPMNSYERRVVHNAFKDDPDVATWSPSDSARIKQITLLKRQRKKEPAQKE